MCIRDSFLIRVEDTRLAIGGYIATQLEELGFTVERVERTSAELSPTWNAGDPTLCEWHLYTLSLIHISSRALRKRRRFSTSARVSSSWPTNRP